MRNAERGTRNRSAEGRTRKGMGKEAVLPARERIALLFHSAFRTPHYTKGGRAVDNKPSDTRQASLLSSARDDFLASVVVFLVALPLCMGIAIASGVDPAAGILTGIIGGLVVGSLAGSPLQVSGPAAGLTVLVYQIVKDEQLGAPMLGVIVLGAGLLQLAAGLFRLGQW